MKVEGSYLSLLAMRFQKRASAEGGTGWNYGAFAFLLTLTTLFLNSFILTEYEALAPLFAPVMIVTLMGLWGMVLGLTVMRPRFDRFMLSLSFAIVVGILALFVVSIISGILSQGAGFTLLGIPGWVLLLLYGGIGVMETSFFQGIQATIRRFWARSQTAVFMLFVLMFVAGVMWHQVVGRRIYQGSIFEAPGYIYFVGVSWVIFAAALEYTGWMDVPMSIHWIWNVGVTALQEGMI